MGLPGPVDIREHFSNGTRRNFGKEDDVRLVVGEGSVATGQALAAYVQHRVCLAAKRHLDGHDSSITALAEALFQHPTTLQRKFRGEESASMAEMLSWCLALGIMRQWTGIWAELDKGGYPKLERGSWAVEPVKELRPRPLPPLWDED
jgi:hypothetical protein